MKLRILRIPDGQERDAQGRGVLDDLLLATFGRDPEDGCRYYLTTDGMQAPELRAHGLAPRQLAEVLLSVLEAE